MSVFNPLALRIIKHAGPDGPHFSCNCVCFLVKQKDADESVPHASYHAPGSLLVLCHGAGLQAWLHVGVPWPTLTYLALIGVSCGLSSGIFFFFLSLPGDAKYAAKIEDVREAFSLVRE